MEHAKIGRFRMEEHLLPVGVVLVAVFRIVESVLDTFVYNETLTILEKVQRG